MRSAAFRPFAIGVLVLAAVVSQAQERIRDVIYMKKGGCAFTMDIFKPATPNHKVILAMVSGGWFSAHENIDPNLAKAFTDQGYTVCEVVHGSQPQFTIPEIVPMIQRAVRFVRYNAATYNINPNLMGITGMSAGGHLSLEIGGLGDDGDPSATDPVDKVSSRVQAVVAFAAPTDFLNWGSTGTTPFRIPVMAIFMPAFGVTLQTPEDVVKKVGHDTSPIYLVNSKFPPTLLVQGDKDMLVPPQQAHIMDDALAAAHVTHKLVMVPGKGHDGAIVGIGFPQALDWFNTYLK